MVGKLDVVIWVRMLKNLNNRNQYVVAYMYIALSICSCLIPLQRGFKDVFFVLEKNGNNVFLLIVFVGCLFWVATCYVCAYISIKSFTFYKIICRLCFLYFAEFDLGIGI